MRKLTAPAASVTPTPRHSHRQVKGVPVLGMRGLEITAFKVEVTAPNL